MTFITFLSKWLHLISIIGVLGTVICLRFVVVPAFEDGESETAGRLFRNAGRLSAVLWGIILLTGLFNSYRVSADVSKAYHMALGGKIALALVMLGLSTVLSHPSPKFAGVQQNRAQWLTAILILGTLVVGLSAHLNISRLNRSGLESPPAAVSGP